MAEHPGKEALRRMVESATWLETQKVVRPEVDLVDAYVAELEAQVAEARERIAYAAESSTVTTSDNPGCFWCDHEEHTKKCWVPGWLERTAPKEGT